MLEDNYSVTRAPRDINNRTRSFLLITPFPFNGGQRYNVNVDAVISRHSGAKTKNGVFYPMGLAYISAVLKQNGFPSRIMDVVPQNFSSAEVLQAAEEADCIVMPIASTRYGDTVSFLRTVKNKTRIGISNFASIYSEKLLKEGICDIVVHGEVESACLEVAQAMAKFSEPDFSNIAGISYIENGKVRRNPDRTMAVDLDSIPFPDREGVDHRAYSEMAFLGQPTAFILTARGCPFKCTFCSTHLTYSYKAYYRSPESVVDEIEEVVKKYNLKNIYFIDDTFTLIPSRVIKICDLIRERRLDIRWACMGRLDMINDALLEKMKESGCIEIRFGVESGNDLILQNIRKQLTVAQIESGIELMKKHRMRYTLFFMLGNAGETPETLRQTIRFAKQLNAPFASFNIATPLPGSALFEEYRDRFAFSDLATFDTLSSNFSVCEVPSKTLRRFLKYAYLSYYFRPTFLRNVLQELAERPKEALTTFRFLTERIRTIFA